MERKPQRGGPSPDPDGVRVVYDERKGLRSGVLLAAIVVPSVFAALLFLRSEDQPAPTLVVAPRERAAAVTESAGTSGRDGGSGAAEKAAVRTGTNPAPPVRRAVVRRQPNWDVVGTSSNLERSAEAGEEKRPEMEARDFIAALRERGETAGLAAFSPPGTRPPRSGVIVPADYDLPEGFARHYQTTDEGRQLVPILVVAPGYEIVDDAGDPVALMDDRIVPPEYAPPDLPVQMLEVPSEHGPGEDTP
jgi:hypothetical protein